MPELARTDMQTGWTTVSLGDVVEVINVYWDRDTTIPERLVAGEHIDEGDMRIRRWGMTDDDLIPPTFNRRFQARDALLHSRNIDKVAQPDFGGITGEKIFILRSKDEEVLKQDLIPNLVASNHFKQYAESRWSGSTNKFLNKTPLMQYEFALPPMEVQLQIADALTSAEALNERLRLCEIRTRELLRSSISANVEKLSGQAIRVGDLIDRGVIASPQDGNHGEIHPKAADYVTEGIPFLMANDVRDGMVDLTECKFITEEQARTLRVGFAQAGDVLLTHKGTLGETAILPQNDHPFAILTPQVTYYRVEDETLLLRDYLYYVFQSGMFYRQMLSRGRQSTRLFVGITAQRELEIPFPEIELQARLVDQWSILESSIQTFSDRRAAAKAVSMSICNNILMTEGDE